MSRITDPVRTRLHSERLHYATGELLGADDFRDEQTYHRRQLSRALLYLHGSGVIAGLRVVANHQAGRNGAPDEVELEVKPGLALDRVGRLIEVPREACLRLRRWFDFGASRDPRDEDSDDEILDRDDLRLAWRADAGIDRGGAVVADVFLAFHPCDRGYTPAFASGPFDALDASQPSRVRDAHELTLAPRTEPDAELQNQIGFDHWAGITGATPGARLASDRERSLDAWGALTPPAQNHAGNFRENPPGVDPTAVLLARLRLPSAAAPQVTSAPIADWSATAWPNANANLDLDVRNYLFPLAALRRIAGI
ncbi:MAG: hypothetical protein ACREF9_00015 [Opitutaceae bacterium]